MQQQEHREEAIKYIFFLRRWAVCAASFWEEMIYVFSPVEKSSWNSFELNSMFHKCCCCKGFNVQRVTKSTAFVINHKYAIEYEQNMNLFESFSYKNI